MPTPGRLWRSVCLGLSWRLTMCGGRRRFIVEEDLFFFRHLTNVSLTAALRPASKMLHHGWWTSIQCTTYYKFIGQFKSEAHQWRSTQTCKLRSSGNLDGPEFYLLSPSEIMKSTSRVRKSESGAGEWGKQKKTTRNDNWTRLPHSSPTMCDGPTVETVTSILDPLLMLKSVLPSRSQR